MADEKEFLMNQDPQVEDTQKINPMTGRPYEVFSDDVNEGGDQKSEDSSQESEIDNEDEDVSMYRENDPIESIFETYKRNFEEEKRQNMAGQLTEAQEEAGNDDTDDEESPPDLNIGNWIIALSAFKDLIEIPQLTAPFGIVIGVGIWLMVIKTKKDVIKKSISQLFVSLLELIPLLNIIPFNTILAFYFKYKDKKDTED